MNKKILIVGGDHHNGLNLARIFSINGYCVECFIITENKKSWIARSKHIKKAYLFKTEKDAFDLILNFYANEAEKPFIFPYSDGAAYELDSRLDEFKLNFYVPSINCEQNKIVKLMDKNNQYKFAVENNINMAKTVEVDLTEEPLTVPNLLFPVILKPLLSAKGVKLDIRICNNTTEYINACLEFKQKNYTDILVQEYLIIDYEIVLVAAINGNEIYLCAHRVLRTYPPKRGTSSYSQTVTDKKVLSKCKELLQKIADIGFCGLIDVECFIVNGELYLNEINWRNSGADFRAINSGYYYPVWYCNSVMGIKNAAALQWAPLENDYSMVEYTDIRHVVSRRIKLGLWLKQKKKVKNFALKFKGDNKPRFYKYYYFFLNKINN